MSKEVCRVRLSKKQMILMFTVLLLMLCGCANQENMTAEQVIAKTDEKVNHLKSYTADVKMEQYWGSQPLDRSGPVIFVTRTIHFSLQHLFKPEQMKIEGEYVVNSESSNLKIPLFYYVSVNPDVMTVYMPNKNMLDGDAQRYNPDGWSQYESSYPPGSSVFLKNHMTFLKDHAARVVLEKPEERMDGKSVYCLKLEVDASIQQEVTALMISWFGKGGAILFKFPTPEHEENLNLVLLLYVDRQSFEPLKTVIEQSEPREPFDVGELGSGFSQSYRPLKVNFEAKYHDYEKSRVN